MKVKEFFDMYGMSSNATITVVDLTNEREWRLFHDSIRYHMYFKYDGDRKIDVGNLMVNTFSVRDNDLIIYAE